MKKLIFAILTYLIALCLFCNVIADDITSEGPDNDYTPMYYMYNAIIDFDCALEEYCIAVESDELMYKWREWLKSNFYLSLNKYDDEQFFEYDIEDYFL